MFDRVLLITRTLVFELTDPVVSKSICGHTKAKNKYTNTVAQNINLTKYF